MRKTILLGLEVAVGASVAVALLVLMLVLVNPRTAKAAFRGTNGNIAYSHWDGNDWEIYAHPYPQNQPVLVRLMTDDDTDDRWPNYSPDGTRIVYSHWDGNDWEIYTINAYGNILAPVQVTNNNTDDTDPCYAATDGSKIAYVASDGNDLEIYTKNANGVGPPFNVTNNNTHDGSPSWSTLTLNGSQYIAYSGNDGNDYELYMIPSTGGTPRRLTDNTTDDIHPDWQSNSNRIAYAGKVPTDPRGDFEIYTVTRPSVFGTRVDTPVQRTSNGSDDTLPAWAPDGTRIAFTRFDEQQGQGDLEIYTMSFHGGSGLGGTPVKLTNNDTNDKEPSWQPRP